MFYFPAGTTSKAKDAEWFCWWILSVFWTSLCLLARSLLPLFNCSGVSLSIFDSLGAEGCFCRTLSYQFVKWQRLLFSSSQNSEKHGTSHQWCIRVPTSQIESLGSSVSEPNFKEKKNESVMGWAEHAPDGVGRLVRVLPSKSAQWHNILSNRFMWGHLFCVQAIGNTVVVSGYSCCGKE